MTNKEMLELVNDFRAWGGNTFTLAMMIVQRQREDDAGLAEEHGANEVAEAIRSAQ